jgi:uncharacterized membrane protein
MMNDSVSILITILTLFVVILLDKSRYPLLQKVLEWVPAILFAYIVPALLTHAFHLDLSTVKLHSFSKNFIMPLAIVLVMSALSIKQLKAVGWRPIAVFVSGSFAVAILPILLLLLSNTFTDVFQIELIDKKYWMGLVTMVGSWIGGSTSQLVLKELVDCPEPIFLIILVLDNLLVNVWTILMFQFIKRSDSINTFFKIKVKKEDFIPDKILPKGSSVSSLFYLVLICLVMVGLCWFFIESFILKVMILSVAGLVFGNIFNWWNHGFVIKIGGFLIIMIMAILGLKLDFNNFSVSPYIILFAAVWLILHYVVMIIVAYFLKINMAWVAVGSMANVGGISTAPAVTKSYNEEWMPHAILLAILSMVTGTYWGMLTIYLFGYLF